MSSMIVKGKESSVKPSFVASALSDVKPDKDLPTAEMFRLMGELEQWETAHGQSENGYNMFTTAAVYALHCGPDIPGIMSDHWEELMCECAQCFNKLLKSLFPHKSLDMVLKAEDSKLNLLIAAVPELINEISMRRKQPGATDTRSDEEKQEMQERWDRMVAEYNDLKQRFESGDPCEILSPAEEKKLRRIGDIIINSRKGTQSMEQVGVRHLPNSNAVEYTYILMRVTVLIMNLLGMQQSKPVVSDGGNVVLIDNDVKLLAWVTMNTFKFIGSASTRGMSTLKAKVKSVYGFQVDGVNLTLGQICDELFKQDWFSSTGGDINLGHQYVTVQRMSRVAACIAGAKNLYSVIYMKPNDMCNALMNMWLVEKQMIQINSDYQPVSLHLAWYLCLGRVHCFKSAVGRHDMSVYRIISQGLTGMSGLTPEQTDALGKLRVQDEQGQVVELGQMDPLDRALVRDNIPALVKGGSYSNKAIVPPDQLANLSEVASDRAVCQAIKSVKFADAHKWVRTTK